MPGTSTAAALIAPAALLAVALAPGSASAVHPASPCVDADAPVRGTPVPHLRRATLCLVNESRVANGLPPLAADPRLDLAAQRHTDEMVSTGTFGHRSADGATADEQAARAGYRASGVGQNLAVGFATPRAVVAAWLLSPEHCRNLLFPDFDDMGTGVSPEGTAGAPGGTWTVTLGVAAGTPSRTPRLAPACPQDGARTAPPTPAPGGDAAAPPPPSPPPSPPVTGTGAPATAALPVAPDPGLRHLAAPRHRRGSRTVVLRVRCTRRAGACAQTVRVTTRRGRATVVLVRRRVRLAAGRSSTVSLRLGRAATRRLARSPRGRLTVRVVVPGTAPRTLTLRR